MGIEKTLSTRKGGSLENLSIMSLDQSPATFTSCDIECIGMDIRVSRGGGGWCARLTGLKLFDRCSLPH